MAATTIIAQTTVPAGDMSATSWFLVSSPTDCRHGEDLDAALKSPRPQGLTTRSASQDNSLIARIDNSSQTSSEDLTETLSKVSLKSSSIKGQKTSEHAHPKDIVLRLEQLFSSAHEPEVAAISDLVRSFEFSLKTSFRRAEDAVKVDAILAEVHRVEASLGHRAEAAAPHFTRLRTMIGNFRLELASKKISAAASESESKGGDLIYLPFDKPHSVPKHLGNDSLRHALDPIASPFSRRALFRTKTEKNFDQYVVTAGYHPKGGRSLAVGSRS